MNERVCGCTALHYASFYGYQPIAQLLLDHACKVDLKNFSGVTPLMWAIERRHLHIAQLLVANGAQVSPFLAHLRTNGR